MEMVLLKCPHCGGDLEFDSSRDIGFCQYCGSKILIKEELDKQRIVIDRKGELTNLIRLAKMSISAGDMARAKSLVDKALEIEVGCKDALLIKKVIVFSTGGNTSYLDEALEEFTSNLDIFTDEDYTKYIGLPVKITYVKGRMIATEVPLLVDEHVRIPLRSGEPYTLHLSRGNHTASFQVDAISVFLTFTVDDEEDYILRPAPGRDTMEMIRRSDAYSIPTAHTGEFYGRIYMRLPSDVISSSNPFIKFDVRDAGRRIISGQPGKEDWCNVRLNELLTITVTQINKKGLFGEKITQELVFIPILDHLYEIVVKDKQFSIREAIT